MSDWQPGDIRDIRPWPLTHSVGRQYEVVMRLGTVRMVYTKRALTLEEQTMLTMTFRLGGHAALDRWLAHWRLHMEETAQ